MAVYGRMTDAELVGRAKSGDRDALDALVQRYAARVSRIAAHVMDDIEDARDAAQESLLKLSERLRQFRGEAQFSTWLHRLVVNTCRDVADRQRIRRPVGDLVADDEPDVGSLDPARYALALDLRRELAAGLARLTVEQRQVILLKDVLDLPYDEIARVVRIPVGTAKCYAHRGRAKLRGTLEEYATA